VPDRHPPSLVDTIVLKSSEKKCAVTQKTATLGVTVLSKTSPASNKEEKVPDKTQIKRLVIPQKKKTMRTHQGLLSQMTSHWIHGGSTLSMKGGKKL
jgi:hypothetical protein